MCSAPGLTGGAAAIAVASGGDTGRSCACLTIEARSAVDVKVALRQALRRLQHERGVQLHLHVPSRAAVLLDSMV